MTPIRSIFLSIVLFYSAIVHSVAQSQSQKGSSGKSSEAKSGTLITETLKSEILEENRIGINPNRVVKVFLPPGYKDSGKSYPVVYFLHNTFWSAEQVFADGNMQNLLERSFAHGVIDEFIFVAADYSTPTTGSIYENSPISGKWLDYTTEEVVPFIDRKFRTLSNRNSRAVTGDFFGGRGALKLAMTHADVFSVAYALHPVATGTGDLPWPHIDIDWEEMHQATSIADITDGRTYLFVTIHQAFLPNPVRPPFYCDFFIEMEGGKPKYHAENAVKIKAEFLLDETLEDCTDNLRTMRGLALDWARFDQTQAHVVSNRSFSRKLEDLGIEHEAEEYSGTPWNKNWIENGRFYSRVLPFLQQHLVFDKKE